MNWGISICSLLEHKKLNKTHWDFNEFLLYDDSDDDSRFSFRFGNKQYERVLAFL
jgi:hypothetical protein